MWSALSPFQRLFICLMVIAAFIAFCGTAAMIGNAWYAWSERRKADRPETQKIARISSMVRYDRKGRKL